MLIKNSLKNRFIKSGKLISFLPAKKTTYLYNYYNVKLNEYVTVVSTAVTIHSAFINNLNKGLFFHKKPHYGLVNEYLL